MYFCIFKHQYQIFLRSRLVPQPIMCFCFYGTGPGKLNLLLPYTPCCFFCSKDRIRRSLVTFVHLLKSYTFSAHKI